MTCNVQTKRVFNIVVLASLLDTKKPGAVAGSLVRLFTCYALNVNVPLVQRLPGDHVHNMFPSLSRITRCEPTLCVVTAVGNIVLICLRVAFENVRWLV